MSFGFKCLTCRNLERISYTYPILSNQFHFLIIITYNYNFACFPFNQSNSINISKFEIYINLYNVGYRLVWGGPPPNKFWIQNSVEKNKVPGTQYGEIKKNKRFKLISIYFQLISIYFELI